MIANLPASRYLASYGKNGALGSFQADSFLTLARGDRVILDTARGLEVGTILCPASSRPSLLLDAPGKLLRPLDANDLARFEHHAHQAQNLFAAARRHALDLDLPLEVLDADILFDGIHAILQILGSDPLDVTPLILVLQAEFPLDVRCENLALGQPEEPPAEAGCGKPDCGKTSSSGGSCSSCSTGSCSSCGTSKPDLRPYFAHLREKMESQRTPLL